MTPDVEYLKTLLNAFRDAPNPTTDIQELEKAGLDYNEPRFEFHMNLLLDQGYIASDSRRGGFGLDKGADGGGQWSVIPLRLTAGGHEFAEALNNSKAFETVRNNFVGASITTIKEVVIAVAKAESRSASDFISEGSCQKSEGMIPALAAAGSNTNAATALS